MLATHLKMKYTSISDVNMWERGWGDICRRIFHILQQATVSPLISKYITTYNMKIYQFCQVFVTMLLLPMWLLLGSVEDVLTALYFLVGMPVWSGLHATAATSSEPGWLVRCFQTRFPGRVAAGITGCCTTPSCPCDARLLWSHMSVKLHKKSHY
jgi:hypothetical protein